jgi:hypothetical protein
MFCEGLWTRVAVLRSKAHFVLVDVFLHFIGAMLICKQLKVLTLESLTLGRVALLNRESKSWVENTIMVTMKSLPFLWVQDYPSDL